MSIMPLVNPLVIAPLHLPSFTNHCAVYICLANANVEARPPALPLSHPLRPSLPMYNQFTVHRSCATISVNYCEKHGRVYTRGGPGPRHMAKNNGDIVGGQIKSFAARAILHLTLGSRQRTNLESRYFLFFVRFFFFLTDSHTRLARM